MMRKEQQKGKRGQVEKADNLKTIGEASQSKSDSCLTFFITPHYPPNS